LLLFFFVFFFCFLWLQASSLLRLYFQTGRDPAVARATSRWPQPPAVWICAVSASQPLALSSDRVRVLGVFLARWPFRNRESASMGGQIRAQTAPLYRVERSSATFPSRETRFRTDVSPASWAFRRVRRR
jgi:hypothetical protein